MNAAKNPTDAKEVPTVKKPYRRPVVQEFGKLHHLTQGTGGNGADAAGPMTKKSDIRTKQNIRRIGDHPLGFGLYLFDYKPEFRSQCGHGRQFGVMADEVEMVMPEAVCLESDGYKAVNYSMLGISHSVQ